MEGSLQIDTVVVSTSKISYKIMAFLGSGGQGEVYDVVANGKHYAFKWYYEQTSTEVQKKILNELITVGEPNSSFLWPKDIVVPNKSKSFGYIMPLRPSNYKNIVDMMKRRAEPTFKTLCRVAFNLTKGYGKLHEKGLCYRDISFGNVFFDPDTGDVLICDNDNVAPRSEGCSVYGTPRFMAPEIVRGKAKPSKNTDMYSLAVLLFYMFMLGHPLEGILESDIKCLDTNAMNKLYGTNPIFVFDPTNKSNRPTKEFHQNLIDFWEVYPQSLKDLFTKSFTVGLNNPSKRVTDSEWLKEFGSLIVNISICKCGAEVFYDEAKESVNAAQICWRCKQKVKMPPAIMINKKNRVLLQKDAKIYSHNVYGDYDMGTVIGSIVQSTGQVKRWGIRNDSKKTWVYKFNASSQVDVAPGQSAAIGRGISIDFGRGSIGKID